MKPFMRIALIAVLGACAAAPYPGADALAQAKNATRARRIMEAAKEESAESKDEQQLILGKEIEHAAALLEQAIDPDQYVLGPSDRLLVNLVGVQPRSFSTIVLPEGYVLIPDVGVIRADGLTLTEFRRELAAVVDRYFRNVDIYCYLEVPAEFRVFVTGGVAQPGAVTVSGVERVSDAVEKAGSFVASGSSRTIVLERKGERIRVDLLRFLINGDYGNNPLLRSGDRIYVPPWGWHANISGQLKRPGRYEIVPGERISDLLDLAGGFTTDAVPDSVVLTRIEPAGTARALTVRSDRFDMPLADLDDIGTFDRLMARRIVRIEGAVFRHDGIALAPGEGVREVIARSGGFTATADLDAAFIEHRDGSVERIDLREYVGADASRRLELKEGDVLTVPEIPRSVTVGGEVSVPGEFAYSSSFTVIHYIGLAGGPSEDGSVNRIALFSHDGAQREGDRFTHPNRGDVIIVKQSRSRLFGRFFSTLVQVGTVVISIIVLTR